eukprot:6790229-Prymnesium_polylepis.1
MVRRQVASVGHDVARAGARHTARVRPSANHLPAQSPAPPPSARRARTKRGARRCPLEAPSRTTSGPSGVRRAA